MKTTFTITTLWLIVCCCISIVGAQTIRTVALSGDSVPGAESDVSFKNFVAPLIDSVGQIAFHAKLAGTRIDTTNDRGIWSEESGTLTQVARTGDHAPGTANGVFFRSITQQLIFNSSGLVAFQGSLSGTDVDSSNDEGIWSQRSGPLTLAARTGDRAPGTPAEVAFYHFGGFAMNSSGQVAFQADLIGGGVNGLNDEGIWSEGSGLLKIVAQAGDAAPGTASGANFGKMRKPVINASGDIAFKSVLNGNNVTIASSHSIWSGNSSSLLLRARGENPAPGTSGGVYFDFLDDPTLNSAGHIAFRGRLSGTGINGKNEDGIWSSGPGSFELVARAGGPAPGFEYGTFFKGNSQSGLIIDASGDTAFIIGLEGNGIDATNAASIWTGSSGSIKLITQGGDDAPGTSSGVKFGGFFSEVALNSVGRIAFRGHLSSTSVDASNNHGIWAEDANGFLNLIARSGDLMEVAPGDFRTIQALHFSVGTSYEEGRGNSFNDRGQLAFRATFTDGSEGVFVSNLVAIIPEPRTFLLFALGIVGLFLRRYPLV